MKKFKLIKEYPGSPKLGHVICCDNFTHNGVDRHSCSNYPEYWEEIIEKDYEILSFRCNNSLSILLELHEDGKYSYKGAKNYSNKGKVTEEECLKDPYYKIHSVKRLSDGEIFTVGDEIYSYGTVKSIIKIDIPINNSNDIGFYTTKPEFNGVSGYQYLFKDKVQKAKKPLFTTEDGIDVYPNNKVSTVLLKSMVFYTIDGLVDNDTTPVEGFKYFSTKKAAEEYIIMNKPCLSINDIINQSTHKTLINELKNIVKLKLK